MRTFSALSLILIFAASCGKTNGSPEDMSVMTDLSMSGVMQSRCGKPGDKGNSLGVGLYCTKQDDCKDNTKATICSTLGNDPAQPADNTYFCLAICSKTSPAGFCGENALCQCTDAGCGCTPASCSITPDGGTTKSDM